MIGERTAITSATTSARTLGSITHHPTIRSRFAITTPITPWATVRARSQYHSLPLRKSTIAHSAFPFRDLTSFCTIASPRSSS